jgi:DnaA family protein|tara:strand:+ start:454 stop:1137 length:684 start_codon:yes stop_codon:yes gene_type:complete
MSNPQQLTFPWSAKPKLIFRDFYTNKENLNLVNDLKEQEAGDIIIQANSNLGKSHLLQSVCNYYNEIGKSSFYLPIKTALDYEPSVLDSIHEIDLICIDDIDFLAKNDNWERAIFNLINQCQQSTSRIIFSLSGSIDRAGFNLPDLISRLNKLLKYNVANLENEDIEGAISLIIEHNSINIGDKEINYILNHAKRDIAYLKQILFKLDEYSLSTKKKITIPLIKEII